MTVILTSKTLIWKQLYGTVDLCSFVMNEFDPTFEVQGSGNGALQNAPLLNAPFPNGSFHNGVYSCPLGNVI